VPPGAGPDERRKVSRFRYVAYAQGTPAAGSAGLAGGRTVGLLVGDSAGAQHGGDLRAGGFLVVG
jgi:hypothetical protein